jgi:hypothetical protein
MESTGESHYILIENLREITLFFIFLRMRLHTLNHLLCFRYRLSHLLHSLMFLVKTIKTKNLLQSEQNVFIFFAATSLASLD